MSETEILDTYTALSEALSELSDWCVSAAQAERCMVYPMAVSDQPEAADRTEVEMLSGTEALMAACRAYQTFQYFEWQDPKAVYRLPGVVFVADDDLSTVQAVNTLKASLQAQIADYMPDINKRLRLCKRLFYRQSMAQIYRQIMVAEEPVRSISMTWSPATVGSKRLTCSQALSRLEQHRDIEEHNANTARVVALSMAIQTLASVPRGVQVVHRRPVPPHPRANIVLHDRQRKMLHANLPFIVYDPAQKTALKGLKTFDRELKRQDRRDQHKLHALHEGLRLYLIEE